jgi:hypothetical protein
VAGPVEPVDPVLPELPDVAPELEAQSKATQGAPFNAGPVLPELRELPGLPSNRNRFVEAALPGDADEVPYSRSGVSRTQPQRNRRVLRYSGRVY